MRSRTVVNVVGGSLLAFSNVGLFWKPIHKFIALFGDAQAARDLMVIVKDAPISWEALYLLIVILSAATLIATNWVAIKRWRYAYVQSKQREWNLTAIDAIGYIAQGSYFSRSLDFSSRLTVAINAFVEAAKNGRIQASGRFNNHGSLTLIAKHVWRDYELDVKIARGRYDDHNLYRFVITDKNKPLYEGIMVDRQQIKSIWPPIPDRY